jgi:protein-S-isoprenylcysteine O-methyltransferase Ste14
LVDCATVPPETGDPTPRPSVRTPPGSPLVAELGALAVTAFEAALLAIALGGVSALVHHSRALALLAVSAVAGVALAALRPVRVHDPKAVAAEPRGEFAALFLIPLVTAPLSAACERFGLLAPPSASGLGWIGIGLVAAGLALRILAMATLGSRFSPMVVVQREHALHTTGPYALVRHPGYLGSWLANVGSALAFPNVASLVLPVVFGVLIRRRLRREERMLAEHFGQTWVDYCARTPRFVPFIRPRTPRV